MFTSFHCFSEINNFSYAGKEESHLYGPIVIDSNYEKKFLRNKVLSELKRLKNIFITLTLNKRTTRRKFSKHFISF